MLELVICLPVWLLLVRGLAREVRIARGKGTVAR